MKEDFTVNKPHIVDKFTSMLFQALREKQETPESKPTSNPDLDSSGNQQPRQERPPRVFTVNEEELKACLVHLGNLVQERERFNFEQYTLFYETLLRQQHQLLYNRERECRSLKSILDKKSDEINVEVQCQMADTCYDLIMGILYL